MTGNSKEELISWIKTIVLAVLIALFINFVLIVNATVPTGSMENTIMTKDRVVALRMSYLFSDPERGDVVIFKYPDDETMLYVKRVIGLPGDTVEIKDGGVYFSSVSAQEIFPSVSPFDNDMSGILSGDVAVTTGLTTGAPGLITA